MSEMSPEFSIHQSGDGMRHRKLKAPLADVDLSVHPSPGIYVGQPLSMHLADIVCSE